MQNRIRALRQSRGVTQVALAKYLNVAQGTLSNWEQGKFDVDTDSLKKLSEYFDVSIDFILGNASVSKKEKSTVNHDAIADYGLFPVEYKKFRVLGEIACGEPIYADEDRETVILADSKIKADFCLYAKGDSMIGARIMDGDIVFIREQPMVENGEIAAVVINDEATLKRVYYYPEQNKISLNAENPKYAPLIYDGEELNSIRILGKAVAFQSSVI